MADLDPIDLSGVAQQFAALVSAVPTRSPSVVAAERAFTDACEAIEANANVLVFEKGAQERRRAEREQRTTAEAAQRQERIDARRALATAARKARK